MSTALLVDGNNLLRSAMAVRTGHGMSHHGVNTGPLLIFINRVAKYVRQYQPSRLMIAWDHGGQTRRHQLLATYKDNRTQAPLVELEERESSFAIAKEFCTLAGIAHASVHGWEADDLVAGAWQQLTPRLDVDRIVIVSDDRDFLQLVGKNPAGIPTVQVRRSGREEAVWDAEMVTAEYGVPKPGDLASVKILMGDKGDNVEGIRGVGPVKAAKLLAEHKWSLAKLVEARPDLRELVVLNRQLVDLRFVRLPMYVPLWAPTNFGDLAFDRLLTFLNRYELRTVIDRVNTGTLWKVEDDTRTPIVRRSRVGG